MFALNDTIVACASAPPAWSNATRAAIRISGPATQSILAKFQFNESTKATPKPQRGIHPAVLHLTNQTQLPIVVLNFVAPNSYTGEHVAELLVPSNPHLVDRLLSWLTSHDQVRLAQPGEFTARAFLRGRLSLEQAEGIGATIAAQSTEQIAAAKELLTGRTGSEYRAWADEITNLLALVEAGIDFTDQEDVVPIAPHSLATRIDSLLTRLQRHAGASAGRESQGDTALPLVALIGKPNAGKSTLFNALLGSHRAVASPLAGTTRDVIIERLDLSPDSPGAGEVLLADLPGLDASPIALSDHQAQQSLQEKLNRADLFIWCDPTGTFDDRDITKITHAEPSHSLSTKPFIRIQTFGDKITSPHSSNSLHVCALDGWNINSLRRAIADHARARYGSGIASLLPRHRRAIDTAAAALYEARSEVNPQSHALTNPEALAEHLRTALQAIGELVGTITPDDVIGRVFATFCVGK